MSCLQLRKMNKYLQESLPLRSSELDKHVDEFEEAGTLLGVAKLGLRVLQDLFASEHWVLVSAQEGPHLETDISVPC